MKSCGPSNRPSWPPTARQPSCWPGRPVHQMFQGGTVWQGDVLIFELDDSPSARLCYAWELDGVVTIVLGEPPVGSAVDAVRTIIMSDVAQRRALRVCSSPGRWERTLVMRLDLATVPSLSSSSGWLAFREAPSWGSSTFSASRPFHLLGGRSGSHRKVSSGARTKSLLRFLVLQTRCDGGWRVGVWLTLGRPLLDTHSQPERFAQR